MRTTRSLVLTAAATTALVVTGATGIWQAQAETAASNDSAVAATATPAESFLRGPAERPDRVDQADYLYSQELMQLPVDQLERTYMGEIVVHHTAVIEMSRIALQRAQHPEIKTMANSIIASQTEQVAGFTELLKTKYGVTSDQARQQAPDYVRKAIAKVDDGMDRRVAMVRNAPSGLRFDQVWLQQVVPHHQTAILESLAVQDGAEQPQLVLMANTAVSTQQTEIAQMLSWLVLWYGRG